MPDEKTCLYCLRNDEIARNVSGQMTDNHFLSRTHKKLGLDIECLAYFQRARLFCLLRKHSLLNFSRIIYMDTKPDLQHQSTPVEQKELISLPTLVIRPQTADEEFDY